MAVRAHRAPLMEAPFTEESLTILAGLGLLLRPLMEPPLALVPRSWSSDAPSEAGLDCALRSSRLDVDPTNEGDFESRSGDLSVDSRRA